MQAFWICTVPTSGKIFHLRASIAAPVPTPVRHAGVSTFRINMSIGKDQINASTVAPVCFGFDLLTEENDIFIGNMMDFACGYI